MATSSGRSILGSISDRVAAEGRDALRSAVSAATGDEKPWEFKGKDRDVMLEMKELYCRIFGINEDQVLFPAELKMAANYTTTSKPKKIKGKENEDYLPTGASNELRGDVISSIGILTRYMNIRLSERWFGKNLQDPTNQCIELLRKIIGQIAGMDLNDPNTLTYIIKLKSFIAALTSNKNLFPAGTFYGQERFKKVKNKVTGGIDTARIERRMNTMKNGLLNVEGRLAKLEVYVQKLQSRRSARERLQHVGALMKSVVRETYDLALHMASPKKVDIGANLETFADPSSARVLDDFDRDDADTPLFNKYFLNVADVINSSMDIGRRSEEKKEARALVDPGTADRIRKDLITKIELADEKAKFVIDKTNEVAIASSKREAEEKLPLEKRTKKLKGVVGFRTETFLLDDLKELESKKKEEADRAANDAVTAGIALREAYRDAPLSVQREVDPLLQRRGESKEKEHKELILGQRSMERRLTLPEFSSTEDVITLVMGGELQTKPFLATGFGDLVVKDSKGHLSPATLINDVVAGYENVDQTFLELIYLMTETAAQFENNTIAHMCAGNLGDFGLFVGLSEATIHYITLTEANIKRLNELVTDLQKKHDIISRELRSKDISSMKPSEKAYWENMIQHRAAEVRFSNIKKYIEGNSSCKGLQAELMELKAEYDRWTKGTDKIEKMRDLALDFTISVEKSAVRANQYARTLGIADRMPELKYTSAFQHRIESMRNLRLGSRVLTSTQLTLGAETKNLIEKPPKSTLLLEYNNVKDKINLFKNEKKLDDKTPAEYKIISREIDNSKIDSFISVSLVEEAKTGEIKIEEKFSGFKPLFDLKNTSYKLASKSFTSQEQGENIVSDYERMQLVRKILRGGLLRPTHQQIHNHLLSERLLSEAFQMERKASFLSSDNFRSFQLMEECQVKTELARVKNNVSKAKDAINHLLEIAKYYYDQAPGIHKFGTHNHNIRLACRHMRIVTLNKVIDYIEQLFKNIDSNAIPLIKVDENLKLLCDPILQISAKFKQNLFLLQKISRYRYGGNEFNNKIDLLISKLNQVENRNKDRLRDEVYQRSIKQREALRAAEIRAQVAEEKVKTAEAKVRAMMEPTLTPLTPPVIQTVVLSDEKKMEGMEVEIEKKRTQTDEEKPKLSLSPTTEQDKPELKVTEIVSTDLAKEKQLMSTMITNIIKFCLKNILGMHEKSDKSGRYDRYAHLVDQYARNSHLALPDQNQIKNACKYRSIWSLSVEQINMLQVLIKIEATMRGRGILNQEMITDLNNVAGPIIKSRCPKEFLHMQILVQYQLAKPLKDVEVKSTEKKVIPLQECASNCIDLIFDYFETGSNMHINHAKFQALREQSKEFYPKDIPEQANLFQTNRDNVAPGVLALEKIKRTILISIYRQAIHLWSAPSEENAYKFLVEVLQQQNKIYCAEVSLKNNDGLIQTLENIGNMITKNYAPPVCSSPVVPLPYQ